MLSDLAVSSLKPTGKQYVVWDTPNFGVRVSQAGAKTFIAQIGSERRKVTIGRYPSVSLKDARRKAQLLLLQPVIERPTETVRTVLDAYRDLHMVHYKGTNKRDSIHLIYKYLTPLFEKPIGSVTARDITTILDPLKPGMQNHVFALFRTFFNWAERRSHVERSPLAKLRKPHKARVRERVLTDEELVSAWRAAEKMDDFGTIIHLCILTGQRRGEVAGARQDWIDTSVADAPVMVFAGSATKNGREHRLPLTRKMVDLFAVPRGPFHKWSTLKGRLDRATGSRGWTIHDLRRTFATNCARLGVQPHVIERILNHTTGTISGIAAVYNRHHFQDEMRQALELHERWALGLVSPKPDRE